MAPSVVVRDLVKEYSGRRALDGVTFQVERGEVFGLIGPNGAGKTTALRILATIIKPTRGYVEVCGKDVLKEGGEVRKLISYLPEEAGTYSNLSGYEYLRLMASFYYSNGNEIKAVIEEGEAISGLQDRLRDKTSTYSKGMRRRLLLARALMVRPKVAILDEPTSGLDVTHAYHLRRVIKSYSKEHKTTVIISSHNMLEVEYLCDRVALINEGRILESGNPEFLKNKYSVVNLEETFMKAVGFVQRS
ncbi:MAG: ABC transporter ATP-binding protein [Candidatus Methanomethylicaceae archaeon]